jgi:excisionase family DNA binding protein
MRRTSQPSLVSREELARRLGVHLRTVDRMAADGRIPYYRCRTAVRFDVDAVLAALRQDGR